MADAASSRVISQVGDSTDDEEMANDTDILQKVNTHNFNPIEYKGNVFHINVPVIFKEMGLLILNSENVKREYRKIKQDFVPLDKKQRVRELDEQIGRGWGVLLDVLFEDYMWNIWRRIGLNSYFRLNQEKINENIWYNLKQNEHQKQDHYLRNIIKIYELQSEIQELNKSIEKESNSTEREPRYTANYKTARQNTKRIKLNENRNDAVLFLARLKGSKKLDKDVAKNALYDYKKAVFERERDPNKTGDLPNKLIYLHENSDFTHEVLKIKLDSGKISHLKNSGSKSYSYKNLGASENGWLLNFPEKHFLQSILRDRVEENDYRIKNDQDLQVFVELFFGIEVKRNPGALLTNAMFLDLRYAGKYSDRDFSTKLPMASKGAVHGSTIIDVLAEIELFDYRSQQFSLPEQEHEWYKKSHFEYEAGKVYEMVKRDENILKDWLEYVRETRGAQYSPFTQEEVSGEVFFDLIKDWYGIEILGLKFGTLKIKYSTM